MKTMFNYIAEKLKITDEVINRKTLPIDDVMPKDKPESTMETFHKAILDYQYYCDELSFDLTQIFGNKLPIFREAIPITEIEAEIHLKGSVTCVLDKSINFGTQSFKKYKVDMINTLADILGEGDVKLGNGIIDCIYEYISNKILQESSISEKLDISKALNNSLNGNQTFEYDKDSGLMKGRHTFIHDYYYERVKIDGYKKLEDKNYIDVYFVDNKIYRQYNGKLTRYLMTEVEDGDTFEEVYDRMIDSIRDGNISLLEK